MEGLSPEVSSLVAPVVTVLFTFTFFYAAWTTLRPSPKDVNGASPTTSEFIAGTPKLQPQQVSQLLAERRSIFPKDLSGAHVPRQQVETILEAANWAPTHGRTEPWRFAVFGREAQDSMIDLTLKVAERELSPEKFEVKKKKLTKKRDEFAKVAWMISIGMKRQPLPDKLNPEWEEEAAVACAVQNIYLMTSALGLGGYWSSWTAEVRDSPEFKSLLGLEQQDKCLGFFMLGTPKQGVVQGYRSSRRPVSDKISWK